MSNLLNDFECQLVSNDKRLNEEDEEVWLGEPSAHLTHVVAYHQVVTEQMQTIVNSLQKQHKQVRVYEINFTLESNKFVLIFLAVKNRFFVTF